jgi:two-component system NarL family sensor kinase
MCSKKTLKYIFSILLIGILISNTLYGQQIGIPSPIKDIAELKVMPISLDKVMHVTRYARHPRMIYSEELKTLLDEIQTYANSINKDDLLANIIATKAIVELGLGNNAQALKYLDQVEGYFPKLSESQMVAILQDFIRINTRIGNFEKTNQYYDKLEAIVKDKPQFIFQRVINLRNRTNLAVRSRDFQKVDANYQLALKLSAESGNEVLLKDTRFAYANALMGLNKEDEAFVILKDLIPYLENAINDKTGQFFEILSRNYQSTGDYKNALIYAERLFNLPIATTQQKSNSINRIIILSFLLKDYKNFDSYFSDHKKYGFDPNSLNSKKQYQLAESIYFDAKQNYVSAKKSYLKALNLSSRREVSPTFDLQILTGLAEVYLKTGKHDSTSFYLKKAESLLKRYPLPPRLKLIYTNSLQNFYQYKPVSNDTLITNLTKQMQLKDTLYQMNMEKVTRELETKYRVNEKEKELKLAKQEQKLHLLELKQAKQKNLLIILVTLVAIILCVTSIYILWQRKKQATLLHSATLNSLKKQHQLEIMNTLSEAQETEKKRIAERLHDEVGAMLSIAKLNINTLQENVYVSGNEFESKLAIAQNLMHDISETVRTISHALMPIAIEKYGFKAAILDLIATLKSTEKLTIEHVIEGFEHTDNWPQNFTLSTYRIIQEIINNVLKHAEASHLFIQLIELAEGVTIYIEDNGKGFNSEDLQNEGVGLGLKLLQTNIEHLAGTLEIEAKHNQGTFVLIEIPTPKNVVI